MADAKIIEGQYAIENRPPSKGLYCCFCKTKLAYFDVVQLHTLKYMNNNYDYTSTINFVCSEECFNLWLIRS